MAFSSSTYAATNVATRIHDSGDQPGSVEIYNPDGNGAVYIGDATVTVAGATKGRPILAGDSVSLDVQGSDDDIYIIADVNPTTVHKTVIS